MAMDKQIDQLQEIKEILEEWALLANVYESQETKDFIESLVGVLSQCHESYLEDVRLNLLKGKEMKAIRESITLIEDQS